MIFTKKHKYILLWAFPVILALYKFIGLSHGYPYISNIDEPALVRSSLGVRFSWWIDHFDWGHFNFYINYAFYEIFLKMRGILIMLGAEKIMSSLSPIILNEPFIFYFLSRLLNTLFSLGTCIPLYFTAKNLFGSKAAILSLVLYLSIPFNFIIAKYAVQESAMLFLLSLFTYYSYRASNINKVTDFILCGIFLGFSVGIKYNAAFFSILLPLMIFISNSFDIRHALKQIPNSLIAAITSILAFLLSTISIFKYWDVFWSDKPGRGVLWQLNSNLNELHGLTYFNKIIENAYENIQNVGYVPALFFVIGFIFIIYQSIYWFKLSSDDRTKLSYSIMFYFFTITMFLYTSKFGRSTAHYFVPLYVTFVLSAVGAIYSIINKMQNKFLLFVVFLFLIVQPELYSSLRPFISESNYSEVAKFLDNSDRSKKIYCKCSDSLGEFNSINNLGYKKFDSEEKIPTSGYVISPESMSSSNLKLVKSFNSKYSLTPSVFIYEKI